MRPSRLGGLAAGAGIFAVGAAFALVDVAGVGARNAQHRPSRSAVTCCVSANWSATVEVNGSDVLVKVEIAGSSGGYVCVSRVVVGTSPGSGGIVAGVISTDPPPGTQANCGYTVTSRTSLRNMASQLAGRTIYVQVETVSSPAAKLRGEEPKVTAAKTLTVPRTTPTPTTTPTSTTTPATTTPTTTPQPGDQDPTIGNTIKRAANTAQLPLDNGKPDCRTARDRIGYLNQELVKAVKNWNFTAGRPPADQTQLEQISRRIARLEADLKQTVSTATSMCTNRTAAAARPARGAASVVRADGRRQQLGAGVALAAGDTVTAGGNSLVDVALPDGSEAMLRSRASLTIGDPSRGKPFVQGVGEIFYRMKKRLGGQREFKLPKCWPDCTASVRGTAFTLAVEGKSVRARVYEGTLAVTSRNQTVLVKKGFESVFGSGNAPSAPARFTAPANAFWVTLVGLWRDSEGHIVRFIPISGGYEQSVMKDLKQPLNGCRYPAGTPYARWFPKGNGLYRVTYVYRVTPLGFGSDSCWPSWEAAGEYSELGGGRGVYGAPRRYERHDDVVRPQTADQDRLAIHTHRALKEPFTAAPAGTDSDAEAPYGAASGPQLLQPGGSLCDPLTAT